MPKRLGTILPTAETIRLNNEYAKNVERLRDSVAREKLPGIECRIVGGEKRYYASPDKYAVISSTGNIRWFLVTEDGDYRIRER